MCNKCQSMQKVLFWIPFTRTVQKENVYFLGIFICASWKRRCSRAPTQRTYSKRIKNYLNTLFSKCLIMADNIHKTQKQIHKYFQPNAELRECNAFVRHNAERWKWQHLCSTTTYTTPRHLTDTTAFYKSRYYYDYSTITFNNQHKACMNK